MSRSTVIIGIDTLVVCRYNLYMYTLDKSTFYKALQSAGYLSARDLCRQIGIHRNSLSAYLSGKGVLPEVIEKTVQALRVNVTDILVNRDKSSCFPGQEIYPIVDHLYEKFPNFSFFLFGSRARGKFKKFSDFDLGVYSASKISFEEYLKVVEEKSVIEEDFPYLIDLVNLSSADSDFIENIENDLILLAGKQTDLYRLLATKVKLGAGHETKRF